MTNIRNCSVPLKIAAPLLSGIFGLFILYQIVNMKNIVVMGSDHKVTTPKATEADCYRGCTHNPDRWNVPDFIIIGTQKGGTTQLHDLLRKHPSLSGTAEKELHFWTRGELADNSSLRERYRDLLIKTKSQKKKNGSLVFESTPSYLMNKKAPERASKYINCNTKFIVSLRNPTARTWSQYSMYVRMKYENRTFAQVLAEELKLHHTRHAYLARGRYLEQLEHWWCFFPRENFLIFCTEDYLANVPHTINVISHFLQVPTATIISRNSKVDNPIPIPLLEKKMLDEYFRVANQQLLHALGSNWCKHHWD